MVLVPQLVELGVIKLTIEQIDQGGEARDRRDIHPVRPGHAVGERRASKSASTSSVL